MLLKLFLTPSLVAYFVLKIPLTDIQFALGLSKLKREMGQDKVNAMSGDEQKQLIRERMKA